MSYILSLLHVFELLFSFVQFRYITGEKFYVQPLGQESADGRVLEIDRVSQEIALLGMYDFLGSSLDSLF